MAIETFKNIIDNKGYRISDKDRKIFERGDLQSFFGFSNSDMIEVVVYDVNDNELTLTNGRTVKYIPLTTENIRDYFLVANGTIFQQYQFPSEYFIDIERILRGEGFNNGIFKVQATLLNARVGTPDETNRLWIQEISPSRTEVRLLPLKNDITENSETYERFNIFVNGGDFREDTLQAVPAFLSKITPDKIYYNLTNKYGSEFIHKLQQEFSIADFDKLLTTIHEKFIESAQYEFSNKISDINDVNYGKDKPTPPTLQLSISDIKNTCLLLLSKSIDKYLPTRTLTYKSNETINQQDSIDNYPALIRQRKSDTTISTNVPKQVFMKVNKKVSSKVPALTAAAQRTVAGGPTGPVISPSTGGAPSGGTGGGPSTGPSTATPAGLPVGQITNVVVNNPTGGPFGGGPGPGGGGGGNDGNGGPGPS